jgi:hypothetical protein
MRPTGFRMDRPQGESHLCWLVSYDDPKVQGLEADLHSDVSGKHLILLDGPQEVFLPDPPKPGEKFWITFADDGVGERESLPSDPFVPVPRDP